MAVIGNEDASLKRYKRGKGLRRRGPYPLNATMNDTDLVEILEAEDTFFQLRQKLDRKRGGSLCNAPASQD